MHFLLRWHAQLLATQFYRRVLGLNYASRRGVRLVDTARPDTIGDALAAGRQDLLARGGTDWAAYQHYGQANAKLLDFKNDEDPSAQE
jgi:hypothetical protein